MALGLSKQPSYGYSNTQSYQEHVKFSRQKNTDPEVGI